MDAVFLAAACLAAVIVYWVTRPGMRRSGIYLPDFVMIGLLAYVVGAASVYYAGGSRAAHTVTLMAEIALLSGSTGMVVAALFLKQRYPKDYVQHSLIHWRCGVYEQRLIYWGLIFSASVCALFSIEVLLNKSVSALLAGVLATNSDANNLLQARKAITSGIEGYFAPGFVKQFRDILVPILLSAVMLMATRTSLSGGQMMIALGTAGIAFIAMLLTGVRSNLFLFFIALFVARTQAHRAYALVSRVATPKRKKRSRGSVIFVIIALVVYGTLTVLLGRINEQGHNGYIAFNVIGDLFDRVIMTVPRENIRSYAFWYDIGPTFGGYWYSDLFGILPGVGPTGLSNLLHKYNGGSIEGNSSLGLAVDVWLNWGWVGLIIVPMLYGVFIAYFDCLLANTRSAVSFGIKVVLALALVKIYSPFGFILYGGMASILLYIGLNAIRARARPLRPARMPRHD